MLLLSGHARCNQEVSAHDERRGVKTIERFELTRRELLKALGGGILILVTGPALLAQRGSGGREQAPQAINAWIHIGPDSKITVFTGKVEVGQNARTSVARAVAEELRVSTDWINVVMADTDRVPFDQGTFGSRTTPQMIPQVRRAAATIREEMLGTAAAKWKTDKASLELREGTIRLKREASEEKLTYGELAREIPPDKPLSSSAELTPTSDWQTLGKPAPKVNAKAFVTGKYLYSSDLRRPDMLFAKVLRPPSLGATLKSVDASAAKAMPGVHVVQEENFVAVAATTLRGAERALFAITAEWNEIGGPSYKDFVSVLRPDRSREASGVTKSDGTVSLNQTYACAYIAHVPLEPRAALAEWDGSRMTVHTGTQRPFGVRDELMRALNLPESQVRVVVPDTGSGYGGKHSGDAAVEAARIAKAIQKPIHLVWTREEEFTFAYFRPAGVIDIFASAGTDGKLTRWEHETTNAGGAGIGTPYAVAKPRTQSRQSRSPLRQGSYRVLAATQNTFARESAMDELADAVGMDPIEFRKANITDPRLLAVLNSAAEQIGWRKMMRVSNAGESGRALGIACGFEKGSYVATAIELEADRKARSIRILRIVTAYECGAILNPMHLKSQVEGCVLMGLGGALFEEIEFENGRILNPRLSAYRVPRFTDMPAIETTLLDRKDLPSAGAGETPIIGIAPAIANAVFFATGARLRSMPLLTCKDW